MFLPDVLERSEETAESSTDVDFYTFFTVYSFHSLFAFPFHLFFLNQAESVLFSGFMFFVFLLKIDSSVEWTM